MLKIGSCSSVTQYFIISLLISCTEIISTIVLFFNATILVTVAKHPLASGCLVKLHREFL